jgi:bacteriorhodopsin
MEANLIIRQTTIISIIIQIITGIIGGAALFVPLAEKDKILGDVLSFEMGVQAIELVFYIFFLYLKDISLITTARYFDWFLSTPVMLLTMSAYFAYEGLKEKFRNESIQEFFQENQRPLYAIFVFNFLMLLSGLLGEWNYIPKPFAFVYGFVALVFSFGTLYKHFVRNTSFLKSMFGVMAVIWSGYGFAFLAEPVTKNISYTILDIFAKNFFGIYLGLNIFKLRA